MRRTQTKKEVEKLVYHRIIEEKIKKWEKKFYLFQETEPSI